MKTLLTNNRQSLNSRTVRGLVAAISACACWGVSFLAPRALPDVPPAAIALLRFSFFGGSSLVVLLLGARKLPKLTGRIFFLTFCLTLSGYSAYYYLLAAGIHGAGIVFSTAVIGLLPLSILLFRTPMKEWLRLSYSIAAILAGIALLCTALFLRGGSGASLSPWIRVQGAVACAIALLLWTYFAVANAQFMKTHPQWSPSQWSSWLGVTAMITSFILFFVTEGPDAISHLRAYSSSSELVLWTGFMGIFGTWIATVLWNYASRILPDTWLGQLLVFETLFGLLYGFLYERRPPSPLEAAAILLLFTGTVFGVRTLASGRSSNAPGEQV
ncbi:MAG: DMT family transporter [Cryobacterium sp.]|nr:DMT family transporter [Oligoflexia bacterium]